MQGKFITTKFSGFCFETGHAIKRGDTVYFRFFTRRIYGRASKLYKFESTARTNNFILKHSLTQSK